MSRISRARRAEFQHRAAQIRQQGQRAAWDVATIAGEIARELPEVTPLEVWRLAYGWSRPQVVAAVLELYRHAGLAEPGLTSARLCRWEHDSIQPEPDYAHALARVYQVSPRRLGISLSGIVADGGYGHHAQPSEPGASMADNALTAVADSVQLQRELEGPGGGPATREQLQRAVDYYTLDYGRHTPGTLAAEIHRCRTMVVDMLARNQQETDRGELRRLGGWLSALLGDLAFTLSDYAGAHIHLSTGARLGIAVGENRLTGWSLGAQSMVAYFGGRPRDALDLAHQAKEFASTELKNPGSGGWAAATVILARAHAAEHSTVEAAALATDVLNTVPPAALRETTRRRLAALDADLLSEPHPGQATRDLHERLLTLPSHAPSPRISPEPNGG